MINDDNNLQQSNGQLTTKKKWIIAGTVIGSLAIGALLWYLLTHVIHLSHHANNKAAHQSDIGGVHFNNETPASTTPSDNGHIVITGKSTRYELGSKITVTWENTNHNAQKALIWYLVGPSKTVIIKNHLGNIATDFVIPDDQNFIGSCKVVITDNLTKPTFEIHSASFIVQVKLQFVVWNTTFYNKNVCKIGLDKDINIDFSLYTITFYNESKPFGQPIKATIVTPLSPGNSGNLELSFTPQLPDHTSTYNLLVTAQKDSIIQTSGISSQAFTFKYKPPPSSNKIILTSKSGGDTFHVGETVNIAITLPDSVTATWKDLSSMTITDNSGTVTNISTNSTKSDSPAKPHPHTIYGTWNLAVPSTALSFTMEATVTVSGTNYTSSTIQTYTIEQTLLIDNIPKTSYILNYWDNSTLDAGILPISLRTTFKCTLSTNIVNTSTMTWSLSLAGATTVTRTVIDSIIPNNTNTTKTQAVFQNSTSVKQFAISFWLDNSNPITLTGPLALVLTCTIDNIVFTSPTYTINLSSAKILERPSAPIIGMTPDSIAVPPNFKQQVKGSQFVVVSQNSNPLELSVSLCNNNNGWHVGSWHFVFDSYDDGKVKGRIQTAPEQQYSDLKNLYLSKGPGRFIVLQPTTSNDTNFIKITDTSDTSPTTSLRFNDDEYITAVGTYDKHFDIFPQLENSTFISSILSDYFYFKINGKYDYWFETKSLFKNPCTCALQGICTK